MSKQVAQEYIRALLAPKIETEVYPCARCGTGVETRWTKDGMLSDFHVVLVADSVFHGSCWDGLLRENPL